MTPEELHEARKAEAIRLCLATYSLLPHAARFIDAYARLVHEDWKPVDPDLIEAREVCAELEPVNAAQWLSGDWDGLPSMRNTLTGIKRGRELERGE